VIKMPLLRHTIRAVKRPSLSRDGGSSLYLCSFPWRKRLSRWIAPVLLSSLNPVLPSLGRQDFSPLPPFGAGFRPPFDLMETAQPIFKLIDEASFSFFGNLATFRTHLLSKTKCPHFFFFHVILLRPLFFLFLLHGGTWIGGLFPPQIRQLFFFSATPTSLFLPPS